MAMVRAYVLSDVFMASSSVHGSNGEVIRAGLPRATTTSTVSVERKKGPHEPFFVVLAFATKGLCIH